MKAKGLLGVWGIAVVAGLYTTFVLQVLWNWFAVAALHAPEISYWTMYGLLLLLRLVFQKPTFEIDEKFKRLTMIVSACVPDEKREELQEELKAEDDDLAAKLGGLVVGEVVATSLALGLGFVVHSFLT